MFLIVGLGNPGRRYLHSRHNVGFRVVETLAARHRLAFDHRKAYALIARGRISDSDVVLAKPQTYMNLSGQSVASLLRWLRLTPRDLLVVYDDLDLPLGTLRLRPSGSAGGHHGMESIIAALGSQQRAAHPAGDFAPQKTGDFARLRIGIGRPGDSRETDDVVEHVLGDFSASERKVMAEVYALAADAIECLLAEGLAAAMNRFNVRMTTEDTEGTESSKGRRGGSRPPGAAWRS